MRQIINNDGPPSSTGSNHDVEPSHFHLQLKLISASLVYQDPVCHPCDASTLSPAYTLQFGDSSDQYHGDFYDGLASIVLPLRLGSLLCAFPFHCFEFHVHIRLSSPIMGCPFSLIAATPGSLKHVTSSSAFQAVDESAWLASFGELDGSESGLVPSPLGNIIFDTVFL